MPYTIYHTLTIKADKFRVYKAISEPEHLVNWWPLKCSGIAQVGEVYNFNFTDKYDWYAKVQSCKIWEHIYFKMTHSDADWKPTTFGFNLSETEQGIQVGFFHKDWQEQNTHFKHSSYCWALLLKGLKDYLEKGLIIPFEKRS